MGDSVDQSLIFDSELIRRYDRSGPRYTSYPTAVQFHENFGVERYREVARSTNESQRPLSLYFHLPFCDTVCFYCACNKVVTKDRSRSGPYLERLHREIALQGELFDHERTVDQLHWGGGTPTFLSHEEMRALMAQTKRFFTLREEGGEYSVEIDPREARHDTISLLRELGFNRMSLGVQDFDPRVQRAVNRLQTEKETSIVLEAARTAGFASISADLIYGLPLQNVESFAKTLEKILALRPDRLSVFNYAHLPELFMPQRRINAADLPTPAEKLAILSYTIERLTSAGYIYIGMDHFAMPEDELARAQREGSLYRNFQGYSTHADADLIGLGATSIGKVGTTYSQNLKDLESYYARLDRNELAIFRGVELDADDLARRDAITDLICHFRLDYAKMARNHGIHCSDYFAGEISELAAMEADGLLSLSADGIIIQPRGKLLIRNICMVFDRYLRHQAQRRFSRVI
ncbi:coproporphyrinogen III dehydrogenase [Gammaproteobacteria bacterium]